MRFCFGEAQIRIIYLQVLSKLLGSRKVQLFINLGLYSHLYPHFWHLTITHSNNSILVHMYLYQT